MRRRTFFANLAAASFGTLLPRAARAFQGPEPGPPDHDVKRVLVMFKCHLDLGFIDTQANVVRKYFDEYFPRAIETAAGMRQAGGDRYVWTTGSWLVHEYLDKAPAGPRKRMEQAIADGDIAWHALPFSWQTELMDQSMIAAALGLAGALDRRFGHTTTGAKMTDVPGHTRAIIGPCSPGRTVRAGRWS
jgi:hypothetical protein